MADMQTSVDPDSPTPEALSTLRHVVWPLFLVALLIPTAGTTLVFLNRSAIHSLDQASPIELVLPISYGIMGALLASRRPRNPIGWIFLGIAIFGGLPEIAQQYVFRNWHFHRLPLAPWAAWSHDWLVAIVFPDGLAIFFFLLFPDGRFQSARWQRLGWVALGIAATSIVLSMFQPTVQISSLPAMRNPIGVNALGNAWNGLPGFVIFLGGLVVLLAAMVGTVLRTRRATGEERQQLKWLAYGTAATVVALIVVVVASIVDRHISNTYFDLVILMGFGIAVPLSCGIAIFKHGLYEIDVVISKTVVYGVLAASFVAIYVAVVVGIGTAIGSTRNPFLTLLAAAVIALAFNPVRNRATRFANRIVYGKRASPYEVLSEFSERMAATYAVEDVLPRMAQLLGQGTGARQARVWLRVGAEMRPAASWGDTGVLGDPLPVLDGNLPDIAGASKVVAVRHREELLGALTVTKPPNEPLSATEGKLVEDLAAQAGLVLRNVRLTEELRANLEELRASRQRLVTAQDEERRRIERNIHDGAQQQLVAIAVKLNLTRSLIGRDDDRARSLVDQLKAEANEALADLRDLARGIYPPLLADRGLVAALDGQARKSPVPVSIEATEVGRFAQEVEAAVYFCCLEALQNASKYAHASGVQIVLAADNGDLRFAVVDNGIGYDAEHTPLGSGLRNMADRVSALGGSIEISSRPGSGTKVTGRIPIPTGS